MARHIKDSYKKLIRKGHRNKVTLIKMLLKRRFDRDQAIEYVFKYVNDKTYVDDMLRELLIWDEISRRK